MWHAAARGSLKVGCSSKATAQIWCWVNYLAFISAQQIAHSTLAEHCTMQNSLVYRQVGPFSVWTWSVRPCMCALAVGEHGWQSVHAPACYEPGNFLMSWLCYKFLFSLRSLCFLLAFMLSVTPLLLIWTGKLMHYHWILVMANFSSAITPDMWLSSPAQIFTDVPLSSACWQSVCIHIGTLRSNLTSNATSNIECCHWSTTEVGTCSSSQPPRCQILSWSPHCCGCCCL